MSKTGAAKVNTVAGSVWCHFSEQGDTLKLRRFETDAVIEFDDEDFDIEIRLPLSECKKLVRGQKTYSIGKNPSAWAEILSALQAGVAFPTVAAGRNELPQALIVPVTRLRRYYSSIRVFEKALLLNLANFYRDHPDALESLWNHSRIQFSKYDNPEGWEEGKRVKLPESKRRLSDVSSTYEFASYFIQHGLADTNLRLIRYEINPWRTRRGMFSTKSQATKTGKGGIDLLLKTPEGLPVVAEVKVKNDKTAFFALLQAMTYAVELSTSNQARRMASNIAGFEELTARKAEVEIAVIRVNPVKDPTLDPVLSLIRLMNQRRNCKGLSQIRLFQNIGEEWQVYS